MKDVIVGAIKKQLIKLAITGVVVAAGLGFRLAQISGDPEWSEAAVEESLQESGEAVAEVESEDGEEEGGGSSLFSFVAGDSDETTQISNRAVPCYVNGQKLFMLHSDCVTRGGLPEMR